MELMPKTDNVVKLPDGRNLGYADYGDPLGKPIFYFHGWPSSRLEGMTFHAAGLKLGARIISPDRPGLGLSDFKKGFAIPAIKMFLRPRRSEKEPMTRLDPKRANPVVVAKIPTRVSDAPKL